MPLPSTPSIRLAPRLLADAVAALHFVVSMFILFGGLLVWVGLSPLWLHLPFAAWGVLVHAGNITCPLTPLEQRLRATSGAPTFEHGFVEQYLLPRRFRGRVTRYGHVVIGVGILLVNVAIYGVAFG